MIARSAKPVRSRLSLAELLEGADEIKKLNADVVSALEGDPVGHEIG